MSFPQSSQYGSYVPTTNVWDLPEINKIDPNMRELIVRLYQNLNLMATVVNGKDSGFYDNSQEFVTGQQYFPNPANNSSTNTAPAMRNTFRLVIPAYGALSSVSPINHNIPINTSFTFTRIYGVTSDPTDLIFRPIPYVSTDTNTICQLDVTATQIVVTTKGTWTNFTTTYFVVEYMKY